MRDSRDSLLKCWVSRELERALRAKSMLARVGWAVEKVRWLRAGKNVGVRRKTEREVSDMVTATGERDECIAEGTVEDL